MNNRRSLKKNTYLRNIYYVVYKDERNSIIKYQYSEQRAK